MSEDKLAGMKFDLDELPPVDAGKIAVIRDQLKEASKFKFSYLNGTIFMRNVLTGKEASEADYNEFVNTAIQPRMSFLRATVMRGLLESGIWPDEKLTIGRNATTLDIKESIVFAKTDKKRKSDKIEEHFTPSAASRNDEELQNVLDAPSAQSASVALNSSSSVLSEDIPLLSATIDRQPMMRTLSSSSSSSSQSSSAGPEFLELNAPVDLPRYSVKNLKWASEQIEKDIIVDAAILEMVHPDSSPTIDVNRLISQYPGSDMTRMFSQMAERRDRPGMDTSLKRSFKNYSIVVYWLNLSTDDKAKLRTDVSNYVPEVIKKTGDKEEIVSAATFKTKSSSASDATKKNFVDFLDTPRMQAMEVLIGYTNITKKMPRAMTDLFTDYIAPVYTKTF